MEIERELNAGVSAITPIRMSFADTWDGLINGVSGAAPITLFDSSQFKTQFACEVKEFDPLVPYDSNEARKVDRCGQLAIVAAREAVQHSRILESNPDKGRIGVIWGSGI